ncbi:hypothetical protein [Bacteroides sedimenti]|uniref:Uncharacterized protein n=1 Tax=Bacteroides sedimenti TaxID=2136147 RepID=A0ABM8ICX3_9BACE
MNKYRFWECIDETIYQNVFVKLTPADIFVERLSDESEDEVEYFIDKDLNKHYLGKIWEEIPFDSDEKGELFFSKRGLTELQIMKTGSDAFQKKEVYVEDPFHL